MYILLYAWIRFKMLQNREIYLQSTFACFKRHADSGMRFTVTETMHKNTSVCRKSRLQNNHNIEMNDYYRYGNNYQLIYSLQLSQVGLFNITSFQAASWISWESALFIQHVTLGPSCGF